jgi:hypothetical protein
MYVTQETLYALQVQQMTSLMTSQMTSLMTSLKVAQQTAGVEKIICLISSACVCALLHTSSRTSSGWSAQRGQSSDY